jgi:hypothetical protein
MIIKRFLHILLVLGVLGTIFYFAAGGFTRPAAKTKNYIDPNFSQLYGTPDKTELSKELYNVVGNKNIALNSNVSGRIVTVTGNMESDNPDEPYKSEKIHKTVILVPITIFRKFADVQRVHCTISYNSRNYGIDVTRDAFEDFVGISANNPANNWESNVVSMVVYDKINRDNFMDLHGLYKPEY